MTRLTKTVLVLGLGAVTLNASGYRIPEQSLNSVALSAAYVAGASGADASYYNPANMAFSESGSELEAAFTVIHLPKVTYVDATNSTHNGDSLSENFYVPTFHYISPEKGNWRFGLSFVAPGGLSKRWDEAYAKTFAEEFSLKILELNPTASYKINDQFAIGFGLRAVYTDGIVKSDGIVGILDLNGDGTPETPVNAKRDMTGDSIDFGYNLALSYKPMPNLTLATTYRSKVNLTIDGTALLTDSLGGVYNGDTSVKIPLPASLTLSAAYNFNKTTVEFVFERTYWSSYKNLDFEYPTALPDAILTSAFDDAKPKNWEDVNAYRIGVTHQYSDKLKLMAGFAIDKTPIPDTTLGFELPGSDAKLYSVGFEYKLNNKMKLGMAYLYDDKESRTVTNSKVDGTFSDGGAHLLTLSLKYRF